MTLTKNSNLILLIIILLIATSCKAGANPTTSVLNSPLQTQPSSIQTPNVNQIQIVPFQLDKPITAGATVITGHGPANVPIALADITLGGSVLGITVIDKQGAFKFKLSQPIESQHRIGITLANLAGTGFSRSDFYDKGFYGDEALSVPQEAFFFDTCLVQ